MDQFDIQIENDDKKIEEFRNILKEIKLAVQEKYLYRSQDTNELKNVEKELIKFYRILYPIVFYYKSLTTIPDDLVALRNKFYITLQEYPRSSYYDNRLKFYLTNDLLSFPFDNSLDRSIVSNKTNLTKM
jgi:hypothetical protein